MRTEVKINGAMVTIHEQSLALNSRLAPRNSTAEFDVEGEQRWATPAASTAKHIVALGGYTMPHLRQSVAINRGNTPFVNCAMAKKIVTMGGNASYIDHFFSGYIATVELRLIGVRRFYHCTAQDYQARITSILVNESYAAQTEQQIIDDLFSTYWNEIDTTTYVDGTNVIASIQFPRILLSEALDQLADLNSKEWYVDYDKKLHYFTPTTIGAPFILSDAPYLTVAIGYSKLSYAEDASKLINRITIIGRTDLGADIIETRTDAASYAQYGEYFDSKYVDRNINTVPWAQAVGDAILAEWAFAKVSGSLNCNQDGLVVGQKVRIINAYRNIDAYYLIQGIHLRMLGALTPEINVNFGDYSPDLIRLLLNIDQQKRREA